MRLNTLRLRQQLTVPLTKPGKYKGLAAQAAKIKVESEKRKFLKKFDEHLVTQELKDGPDASFSYFLPDGNLFAFLGFYEGTDPAGDLRQYLETNVNFKPGAIGSPKVTRNRVTWAFQVETPTLQEVYDETEVHGDQSGKFTGSWVRLIEKGLDNFLFFVFTDFRSKGVDSKSGFGLQKKKAVRDYGSLKPTKYVSTLLTNFIKGVRG
ncbi:MAG: hypothetical protein Q8O88_04970 [bacterium]|nr:hypothetical protein [bacterium]